MSSEEKDEIMDYLNQLPADDKLTAFNFSGVEISNNSMKRLLPERWLDDSTIEYYLRILNDSNKDIYCFNSFFMTKLLENDEHYNYKSVQRWTKHFDIFEKKKILFAINITNAHWTLVLLDMRTHIIKYYDNYRYYKKFGPRYTAAILKV